MLRAYTKQMGMDGPFSLILSFASSIFPLILTSSRHHSSAFRAGSAPVEHRRCGQGHKTNAPRVCNRHEWHRWWPIMSVEQSSRNSFCDWLFVLYIIFSLPVSFSFFHASLLRGKGFSPVWVFMYYYYTLKYVLLYWVKNNLLITINYSNMET